MKAAAVCAVVGAVLGALIAVIVHFLSHTLPSSYDVVGVNDGRLGTQTLASPLVHPSWFPVLPAAIAIGAVVGAVLVTAASWAGYTIIRRELS
jgi:hypothetical protein